MPSILRDAVAGALKVSAAAAQTEPWKSLDDGERRGIAGALMMAAQELPVNAVYYGMLKLDPETKAALTQRGSLEQRVKHEAGDTHLEPEAIKLAADRLWKAACRELHDALRDPERRSGTGLLTMAMVGEKIIVTVEDSGKFTGLEAALEASVPRLEDPDNNPHGYGLLAVTKKFDSHEQDPVTGRITLTLTAAGLKQRVADLRAYMAAEAAKRAAEAADREATKAASSPESE